MKGIIVALIAAALASGSTPKQRAQPAAAQQAQATPKPAPVKDKPPSASPQQPGCPGTPTPQLRCDAVTAEATVEQTELMRGNTWLSFFTVLVAGAAAAFAAAAAKAARNTVNAFTEVEQATLFVDLEQFQFSNVHISFDIVANNLGRSAALVSFGGHNWLASNKISDFRGTLTDIRAKIVPAAGRITLKKIKTTPENVRNKPYFWLLIDTISPLQGEIVHRSCWRVMEGPNTFLNVTHTIEFSDEIKKGAPATQWPPPSSPRWWEFWR